MEQGRTYRFGFSLGSGWFQVAPEDDPVWDSVTMSEQDAGPILRGELPKDIQFVSGDGLSGSGAGGWEPGVVYNPDGMLAPTGLCISVKKAAELIASMCGASPAPFDRPTAVPPRRGNRDPSDPFSPSPWRHTFGNHRRSRDFRRVDGGNPPPHEHR